MVNGGVGFRASIRRYSSAAKGAGKLRWTRARSSVCAIWSFRRR